MFESDLVVAVLAIETSLLEEVFEGGSSCMGEPEGASSVGRLVGFAGDSSSLPGAERLQPWKDLIVITGACC